MSGAKWHLPFGADLVAPDRTRFRIWAPTQRSLALAIEDGPRIAMTGDADGWFEAEARCGPGARYRYVLDDGTAVPDPASRAQDGDIHGASIVIDPRPTAGNIRIGKAGPGRKLSFTNCTPDYSADLPASRVNCRGLPNLASPPWNSCRSPNFPAPAIGATTVRCRSHRRAATARPDDLSALVDAAHALDLMIFLDVVYNHFGPDGNYLPLYAPQIFRNDVATPWGPAIDFRRREVRGFFTANALYWLTEYRFDGLRFDAVHAITESDWLDEMAAEVRKTIGPGRHVHLVLENDNNEAAHLACDFDAQWNDDGHHVLHVLLTGEREAYYRRLRRRRGGPAGALPAGRLHLSGRALRPSERRTARHPERRPAADRIRPVPAKSRSDRQPRLRRTPDRASRSEGTRGGDRAAAAVPADPADVHGRGDRDDRAVSVLHRSQ